MDVNEWRNDQRRLREALRNRRTPDGRRPAAPGLGGPPHEANPPDLLGVPISSHRGVLGQPVVATKKLLRRLLGPPVLEPQARFNQQVAGVLAELREELDKLRQSIAEDNDVQFDYLAFENRFRGKIFPLVRVHTLAA